MKRLILFLIAAIFAFNIAAQQRDRVYKDDNIGIKLDLIEKTDNSSSELKLTGYPVPKLKEGYNYVVVYFTVEIINNIHVVSFGGRGDEKSIMYDDRGEIHKLKAWNSNGWKYIDPDKGLASPSELTQGSKGIMVFEFLENENPKELAFVYYFKDSWDDEHNQKGKINILIVPTTIE
jgi:hypothetical protein